MEGRGRRVGGRERRVGGRIAPSPRYSSPSTSAHPQAWAIYKGKCLEGIDKQNLSTWKTRLRCALNKSADFCEVRERSQLDISNPYKVCPIVLEGACGPGTNLPLEVVAKDGSTRTSLCPSVKWEMVGL